MLLSSINNWDTFNNAISVFIYFGLYGLGHLIREKMGKLLQLSGWQFLLIYCGIRKEPSFTWRHYAVQAISGLIPFTICFAKSSKVKLCFSLKKVKELQLSYFLRLYISSWASFFPSSNGVYKRRYSVFNGSLLRLHVSFILKITEVSYPLKLKILSLSRSERVATNCDTRNEGCKLCINR